MRFTKLFSFASLLAVMLAGAGCGEQAGETDGLKVRKVTDYLYETTLDYEFDFSVIKPLMEKYRPSPGACTAISIGNLRGRNLDWYYADGVEFIVRTTKTATRHASIGVSSLTSLDNEAANDGKFHEQFVLLPFITLDGINDAGIFVNLNIVGFQEMGAWEMKTETTDDDMLELIGPRLILDNCSYLTDIVPLYEKYDWISLGKEDETHFMVTGPRSADDATVTSVVFELIPFTEGNRTYRRLCCISQDEKDIVLVGNDPSRFHHIKTDYLIMSNFNLWQFDPSLDRKGRLLSASAHPMGFERYETVEAVANSAAAIAGGKENLNRLQMQDIMRSVYYSNYCNLFNPNFWYSDFYPMYDKEDLISITEEQRNPRGNLENLIKGADNKTYETIKRDVTEWSHRDRKVESTLWETLYTCIYDYGNRSFQIILHEGMIDYEFKL